MAKSFSPQLFKFLNDLAANNERDWFNANKARYEEHVKEPSLQFIEDFAPRLKKISPHLVADSRSVGGSMFRIYRDTRFSKDKTPYKEYTGIQFRHERAKDVHAPGFYLHLQPRQSYLGAGLWRPETKVAYEVREHIAAKPAAWKKAVHSKKVLADFTQDGDSLTRPPKGYDADDPMIEELKRKDFIVGHAIKQTAVTGDRFIDEYERLCKVASPMMAFLCEAVGLEF